MKDLDIKEVSYVDGPANRRKYLFIKDQDRGGGEKNMEPVKLENLSYEDRQTLETQVENRLLPDLKKKMEETYRPEFEKNFNDEKVQAIKDDLRIEIERDVREEFGKQETGVSPDAATKITAALKDIIRGVTALGKIVGYGYKSSVGEEDKREALEKQIDTLRENMITENDLKELVGIKK